LRILHVVPTYLPAWRYGGLIHSVHGLCRALAQRGHEVHVFTTTIDGPKDLAVPTSHPVDVEGVSVHYFPPRPLRRLYHSPPMRAALDQQIGGFDLLHLHSIFLWPTHAGARAARDRGIPYVLAPRGMLVKDLISRKRRWLKTAWLTLIERRNLEGAAAIHFTSALERDEAARFGWRLPRSFVVPNGVDTADQVSVPAGDYFLFVGRINWKKGLDRLIAALAEVPAVKLKIAGNDEENYRQRLEALALDRGVSDRIEFLGYVEGTAKLDLYRGAIALVLPSLSENFGNVVVEAMSTGCPVIVTPAVGLAAAVESAGAGLVVEGDPAELATAMQELSENRFARMRMGANGRRLVADQFTWGAVAEQMESAYRQIIQ
jgi:glycosyltransferase involved in cell wall biosynthesis